MVGLENLALALAGIDHRALGIADDNPVRDLLDLAAARGVRAVQFSAAAPGARPRDLDRSGRRDLAAAMRRRGLALAGVDLWIPREHMLDPALADRALSAITDAVDFAGELAALAGLVPRGDGPAIALSVALPAELAPSVRSELDRRAQSKGVALADHTPGPADGAAPIGTTGVDPAALLAVRRDPAGEVIRLGPRLGAARLSDLSDLGLRVVPGEPGGRLDLLSYGVAIVTAAYPRPVPIDLRGVADQPRALEAAVARFVRPRSNAGA